MHRVSNRNSDAQNCATWLLPRAPFHCAELCYIVVSKEAIKNSRNCEELCGKFLVHIGWTLKWKIILVKILKFVFIKIRYFDTVRTRKLWYKKTTLQCKRKKVGQSCAIPLRSLRAIKFTCAQGLAITHKYNLLALETLVLHSIPYTFFQ